MELGVIGMMLNKRQSVGRSVMLKLTGLAQVALLMFVGSAANAQEGNRLQDIQVQRDRLGQRGRPDGDVGPTGQRDGRGRETPDYLRDGRIER